MLKTVLAFLSVFLFFSSTTPSDFTETRIGQASDPIGVTTGLEEVLHVPSGSSSEGVGYFASARIWPTSFEVNNGAYYILDPAYDRILVKRDGATSSINLSGICWAKDLAVAENGTIYVLDSCEKEVHTYTAGGDLVRKMLLPGSVFLPIELRLNLDQKPMVKQAGANFYLVEDGDAATEQLLRSDAYEFSVKRVSDESGVIQVTSLKSPKLATSEIRVGYKHSFGVLDLLRVTDQSVLTFKTDVVPDEQSVQTESYVELLDLNGRLLGGSVRIPIERMANVPDRMVKAYDDGVYVFSVEKDGVHIYKLQLNH